MDHRVKLGYAPTKKFYLRALRDAHKFNDLTKKKLDELGVLIMWTWMASMMKDCRTKMLKRLLPVKAEKVNALFFPMLISVLSPFVRLQRD